MACLKNKTRFTYGEAKEFLQEAKDTEDPVTEYILQGNKPSKFLSSSQTNANYVTTKTENDTLNIIEPRIIEVFKRAQLEFTDEGKNLQLTFFNAEDVQYYLLWRSMKAINAFLYDGENSLIRHLINNLEKNGYLEKTDKVNKILHKKDFVDGMTGIATAQYEFLLNGKMVSVFNDKEYIDIEDIVSKCSETARFNIYGVNLNQATDAIFNKFKQNSIFHKAEHENLIKIDDFKSAIYNHLDITIKRIQSKTSEQGN